MKEIKIYGNGCTNCNRVKDQLKLQRQAGEDNPHVEYISTDTEQLVDMLNKHNTSSVPLVLVDGEVFYWGNWVDIMNKVKGCRV